VAFSGIPSDPGLTAAEMKQCVWVKPIVICEVKFTVWTRDDRLRHPAFIGLRKDKNLTDVVREKAIEIGSKCCGQLPTRIPSTTLLFIEYLGPSSSFYFSLHPPKQP